MIQKKSLKDAIQNPEIISVVGELLYTGSSNIAADKMRIIRYGRLRVLLRATTYYYLKELLNFTVEQQDRPSVNVSAMAVLRVPSSVTPYLGLVYLQPSGKFDVWVQKTYGKPFEQVMLESLEDNAAIVGLNFTWLV